MTSTQLTHVAAIGAFAHEHLGIRMDPNGLTFTRGHPKPTYEEWEIFARGLGTAHNALPFVIGDTLNWGESLFGQESAQVVDPPEQSRYDAAHQIIGIRPETLINYASVARRVAKSRRRIPPLKFRHHDAVASLEPDDQIRFLQLAIDEGLNSDDLRKAIRDELAPPGPEILPPEPSGNGGLSRSEQIEAAAARVYHQGQPQSGGGAFVPPEPWVQLAAALGEGE